MAMRTSGRLAWPVEAALQGLDAEEEGMWKKQREVTSAAFAPLKGYEMVDDISETSVSAAVTALSPIAGPGHLTTIVNEPPRQTVSAPGQQSSTSEADVPVSDPTPAVPSSENPSPSSLIQARDDPTAVETPNAPAASVAAEAGASHSQAALPTDKPAASNSSAPHHLSSAEPVSQSHSPPVPYDSAPSSSAGNIETIQQPLRLV
ncbi:hypothetical protein SISSUDRAFT_1063107 [Sistotremastrum suecicum HHB10207 ss-3]|uniref:Uncharacterized protein n=1 Tax=Sistotremastrum suecicum HHB10207 ss-3 TaxID=1314776 RepID=A0A166C763_9AGAM|nr:hypothetical protein SISSUDRAFT_1063107 [Sistotremastrum suecicum HHB10207 ss-3]